MKMSLLLLSLLNIWTALAIDNDTLPRTDPSDHIDINAKPIISEIFDQILSPPDYLKSVRPMGSNGSGPVVVSVYIRLRSLENLDDYKRQHWIDPRLQYSHLQDNVKYLQLIQPDRSWLPDIFFSNEKSGNRHEITRPNLFARIHPNGKVETNERITLLLACQMDLHYYPMDKQSCPIEMGSYGWTEDDLKVIWRNYTAVEVKDGIRMPQFKLISFSNDTCPSVKTSSGTYSCIVLNLNFSRQFGYYLIQIYIPCIMLVVVSWVSFFLEPLAAEARISLCVTTILTVVTQAYGINQSVPPASYIKAIDVWTFTVQLMVFAAILQFSYVNYVARFEWKRKLKSLNMPDDELEIKRENFRLRGERKAKFVDNVSKIIFPVFFGIFNLIYWITYLKPTQIDTTGQQEYDAD